MKTVTKSIIACAVALAVATVGTSQAKAGPWAVAAGVTGGLAAGAVIGATVASAYHPDYYGYPGAVYPGPVVAIAPAWCYPRPIVVAPPVPYVYPGFRVGYGWRPHYGYWGGYRGYRRW
jgi:hypothetical protein